MALRIGFVVQRYGQEIRGGAETHCRLFAERLAARGHKVEAFSSCALDHATWANEVPAGETLENGVAVHRFPTRGERHERFPAMSEKVLRNPSSTLLELQERWMRMQGPEVPGLLDAIGDRSSDLDVLVFFTYLYYPTYFGLPAARTTTVLHPTVHDEPPIYLSMFDRMMRHPSALVFSTKEERDFAMKRFDLQGKTTTVIGIGTEPAPSVEPVKFRQTNALGDSRLLLYLGRAEEAKGIEHLVTWFTHLRDRGFIDATLVVIGQKSAYRLPDRPDIRYLGTVDDQTKWDALAAADLLILPSSYESFSMALLEAWSVRTPALVNGFAHPVVGHCQNAGGGGVWYRSYGEFSVALRRLLDDRQLRERLGGDGQRYVEDNFRWDTVMDQYEAFLHGVSGRPVAPR